MRIILCKDTVSDSNCVCFLKFSDFAGNSPVEMDGGNSDEIEWDEGVVLNEYDEEFEDNNLLIENPSKKLPECIEKWNVGLGINKIRCKVCSRFPKIVSRYTNNIIPRIAQNIGAQFRSKTLELHLATKYHAECLKADKLKPLIHETNPKNRTTLDNMILGGQAKVANIIGRRAISVYADAKCLSNSARSWAARQMAEQFAECFEYNDVVKNEENIRKISMNYLNPNFHAEILDCITSAEKNMIANKLKNCISLSLRMDGSVDRTCLDKIYVIAKTVNPSGKLESIFVGVGVQTERKASGLFEAMKRIINYNGEDLYELCMKKMTSFVTDGAGVNTGERSGLWAIIDQEAKRIGVAQKIVKIWCAAHRSDLILKDLKEKVPTVKSTIDKLKHISSYFHVSAMRSSELEKVARENSTELLHLPKYFEVRWAEFTHQLLQSILVSWNTLVLYFTQSKDPLEKHFKDYLTNYENLQFITFMADVIYCFKVFQQKLQTDDLNIITLNKHLNWFRNKIELLSTSANLGEGWVCKLETGIKKKTVEQDIDGTTLQVELKTLKGIMLNGGQESRCTRSNNQNSNRRNGDIMRRKVTKCILQFLKDRFSVDEKLVDILGPFCKLEPKVNVKEVMNLIAPDADDFELQMQYDELCDIPELKELSLLEILPRLAAAKSENFSEILNVFARIAAATPHSADVERSISANNRLKTNGRANFDIESENKWLFIHFNLPALENWDPRKTVVVWMNRKERRHHELTVEASENGTRKTTSQPYFKGIFQAASASGKRYLHESEDGDDGSVASHLPKRIRHRF